MSDKHTLLWIFLQAIWLVCAVWQVWENRAILRERKDKLKESDAKWLKDLLWSRSAYFLVAFAICNGIIAVYGLQLSKAEDTIDQLSKEQQQAAAQPPAPQNPAPAAVAAPQPATPQSAAPATPTYYPPTATAQQVADMPAPVEEEDESSSPSPGSPSPDEVGEQTDTVNEVYNPEQKDSGASAKLDEIKKRYEDLLVTYFYLSKCGKARMQNYQTVLDALDNELTENHAPATMHDDILESAQGSYQEVYANSHCDAATIDPLIARFLDYMQAITHPQAQPAPQAQPQLQQPQQQPQQQVQPAQSMLMQNQQQQPQSAQPPASSAVQLQLNPPGTPQ